MSNEERKPETQMLSRKHLLQMLEIALGCQSYSFGRQAALAWLAVYPGDLEVMLFLAEMLAGDHRETQALEILDRIIVLDPEFQDAHQVRARIARSQSSEHFVESMSSLKALGEILPPDAATYPWAETLFLARQAYHSGHFSEAEALLEPVMMGETIPLLGIILHLRLVEKSGEAGRVVEIAEKYLQSGCQCVELLLRKSAALITIGRETEAVKLLHQCVTLDSTGQVARRIWGDHHPYRSLWPAKMECYFDLPLPVAVATRLTGAWLPPGEGIVEPAPEHYDRGDVNERVQESISPIADPNFEAHPSHSEIPIQSDGHGMDTPTRVSPLSSEELKSIEGELRKVAIRIKQPVIGKSDGRFPVYVIFSSKQGLIEQYGEQTAQVIDLEMRRLGEAIKKHTGWDSLVFYPDDPDVVATYGFQPLTERDPWKLKLSLSDLDKALSKKGKMIGMLLIVGGPQVIPFHELPNPADDFDEKIFSDNPYATLGSNYFVPEWPVGRLPGATGPDAGLLLDQLRRQVGYHNGAKQKKSMGESSVLWPFLWMFEAFFRVFQDRNNGAENTGYTAAVWRRSSTAVFRPVGNPAKLLVSPPQDTQNLPVEKLLQTEVAYYNLHGMEDTPEWYGQRDPFDPIRGPDYPVALMPSQLKRNGHAPKVVFSEACYGGHIVNKTEDTALALKFLSLGTLAMIGSTCIAYGAITPPLVSADLLGNYFWQQMKAGRTAGEALMIAKIEMSREMVRRQGYLDAEDQKTLLSFVLYGDPLVRLENRQKQAKTTLRLKKHPKITVVNEKPVESGEPGPLSFKVLEDVKQKLAGYLPGIDTAEIHIAAQSGSDAPALSKGSKGIPHGKCYVVTVSKQVPWAKTVHRHYARATVAADGKVIKLAVSR
ncbi:peptidase family C25 [Anaerolinea thermolimosa]|uniref:C25 family cysteine peptidase n=1 Tax=Anaerolinea thermolimosa TaxID=229919 RepID=UPI00078478FB|nr:C25 family cysteine peptidase [Anaerolinea thermolimosa]GAP06635.1 peptidase family C25 [Anaerolinea thermolimosa]